ncbi:MAG: hypothetical protein ACPGVP_07750 [Thiolinea sp.]
MPDIKNIIKNTHKAGSTDGLSTRSPKLDEPDMLLEIHSKPGSGCKEELIVSGKQLLALPQHNFSTKHTWTKEDKADTFSGPLLSDVMKLACPEGVIPTKLHMRAMDGYAIDVSYEDSLYFKPTLALSMNGERMKVRNMGHLWLMAPLDDFKNLPERSLDEFLIWQLYHISITETKK